MAQKYVWLITFYAMQVGAYLLFKFGSTSRARWLPCFIAGNVLGITCMWIMMRLFTVMNANLAVGLSVGGGFLCGQIALALVFGQDLTVSKYIGMVFIGAGLFLLSGGYVR